MNYIQGVEHMIELSKALKPGQTSSFEVGTLIISYPGYKKPGDYQLSENKVVHRHTDVVNLVYEATTKENFQSVVTFLEDVYKDGLMTKNKRKLKH